MSVQPHTLRFLWAVRDAELSPRQKHLLLTMATYANEENQCWPSRQALALQLGVSESTIKREVTGLVALGWIHRKVRRGRLHGATEHQTNLFTLLIPTGSNGSEVTGSNGSDVTHKERHEERQVEERQEDDSSEQPVLQGYVIDGIERWLTDEQLVVIDKRSSIRPIGGGRS